MIVWQSKKGLSLRNRKIQASKTQTYFIVYTNTLCSPLVEHFGPKLPELKEPVWVYLCNYWLAPLESCVCVFLCTSCSIFCINVHFVRQSPPPPSSSDTISGCAGPYDGLWFWHGQDPNHVRVLHVSVSICMMNDCLLKSKCVKESPVHIWQDSLLVSSFMIVCNALLVWSSLLDSLLV
jgi:hypothetical protein